MGSLVIGIGWLLVMFYIMLFCQHRVCEAYFVPALNVLMDRMGSSKNKWLQRLGNPGVAGATFMALGANGPELFTNLFSIYAGSDGGIGVVIGSEIFNLLVIIGASSICSKVTPIVLEKISFARDVLYYALSIALLLWALADAYISRYEATVMLMAGLSYWIVVYFTPDIADKITGPQPEAVEAAGGGAKIRGVDVEVEIIYHARMADGHGHQADHVKMEATPIGILAPELDHEAEAGKRGSVGFELMGDQMLLYKDLSEVVVVGEGVLLMSFNKGTLGEVTFKCKASSGEQRDILLENLKQHARSDKVKESTWIHDYDATCMNSIKTFKHHFSHGGTLDKIHAVLELFIDFALSLTLFWCDVKDINKEKRWIPCFMGAMFWLAAFSFAMVQVMNEISANIAFFTPMLLGVTFGAIGTSLPNAMGSVMMAQQGKSAAAIGNAFGSNVQNVFLAMAGPWMIYMCTSGDEKILQGTLPGTPPPPGQSISEGVVWMLGTLILVVFCAILPETCTFSTVYGYLFIVVYVGYLGWTTYEFASVK